MPPNILKRNLIFLPKYDPSSDPVSDMAKLTKPIINTALNIHPGVVINTKPVARASMLVAMDNNRTMPMP